MAKQLPKLLKEIYNERYYGKINYDTFLNMILFGASGHSKSIIDIAFSIGQKIEAIYDDNPQVNEIFKIPVKKFIVENFNKKNSAVISIGNNLLRKNVSEKLFLEFNILVHKDASVSSLSSVDKGTVVMANATVNAESKIGKHCIINSGSVVEHDCILGDFVHISPNASLGGGVNVGEGSHIGIGAVILPLLNIGKWTTIGAGAVIIKDVPDNAVVVGNPGKILKFKI